MIESAFNQLFQSEIMESYRIVVTTSINSCPNLIKTIDLGRKKLNLIQNGQILLKMVEF